MSSFAKITNTAIPSPDCLPHILSSWNCFFLDDQLRDFIYKCRHNILRTGDRLSHLVDVSNKCYFCKSLTVPFHNKETFQHLFRSCPVTSSVLEGILVKFNVVIPLNDNQFDSSYWYGIVGNNLCKPTLLFFDIYRYCIWVIKQRKSIPNVESTSETLLCILGGIFKRKPSLARAFNTVQHLQPLLQAMG